MRIAQVASLLGDIPPNAYGGPERVISYLTEELVQQGHEVTLFATAGSQTQAKLIPCAPKPLLDAASGQWIIYHMLMLEQVYRHEAHFDIIHCHLDFLSAPFARRHQTPTLTTMHVAIHPGKEPIFREYAEFQLAALSEFQRQHPLPWVNWQGTVHNGIPLDLYSFEPQAGEYLLFLGRISPAKGVNQAMEIATQSGIPLKIAGNIDIQARAYFEEIQPLFDQPHIEYLGEVNDIQKQQLLGNARALLFPIEAEEAFGLVMIEAMACGTPVIAYRRGSVPEIMTDGENGFIVQSIDEAVTAIEKLSSLSRARCRALFEERFTATHMTNNYVALYEQMIG